MFALQNRSWILLRLPSECGNTQEVLFGINLPVGMFQKWIASITIQETHLKIRLDDRKKKAEECVPNRHSQPNQRSELNCLSRTYENFLRSIDYYVGPSFTPILSRNSRVK